MPVELHLPDLPELPIGLGPASGAPRRHVPWHLRVRDALSAYLPLLLMALLALATWWLVKVTPLPPLPTQTSVVRHDPDYTMEHFVLERFDAGGRLEMRLEGDRMRHFPDTDRIEVDAVRVRGIAPDGRVTLARADRALSNGDGSEIQLFGNARVDSVDAAGRPLSMRGEFLHAFLARERVRSHLPVTVETADATLSAGGLDYDHGQRRLQLQPPVRVVVAPPARRP